MLQNERRSLSLIEKFMRIPDSKRYVIMVMSGVVQAIFSLIVMILINVKPLIFSCSIGIMLFLSCLFLAKKNKILATYYLILAYGIISLLMAAFLVEWDFGFQNYLFVLIPLSYTFLYISTDSRRVFVVAGISMLCTFFCYLLCLTINSVMLPVTNASVPLITTVKAINALLIMLLLFIFVSMFVIRLFRATTKTESYINKLDYEANYDVMTGLYNRRFAQRIFTQFINEGRKFDLILCDIDYFKKINDKYGHSAGDAVLKELASIIMSNVRSGDYCVRWGGEELLIILKDGSADATRSLLNRLFQEIRETSVFYENQTIKYSITAGATHHFAGDTIDDTIVRADNYLYEGKEKGRNQFIMGCDY